MMVNYSGLRVDGTSPKVGGLVVDPYIFQTSWGAPSTLNPNSSSSHGSGLLDVRRGIFWRRGQLGGASWTARHLVKVCI